MPFHVDSTGDEGNVGQVKDAQGQVKLGLRALISVVCRKDWSCLPFDPLALQKSDGSVFAFAT